MMRKLTVTRAAGIVMVASVALVTLLILLRMMGWLLPAWWINGLIIVAGVLAIVAFVVRFFARRAFPRWPRNHQNRKPFGGR